MKALFLSLLFFTLAANAEDPTAYFTLFDNKVYSLKTKGVKDFVVDITSSKLTQQINDQKTFGTVKKVMVRAYWTANPERLDLEVLGLPEGFREAKEELKASVLPLLDNIIPMTIPQRFTGYKFSPGSKAKEFLATDTTGVAPIPSFVIRFDAQDRLTEIVGNRPIGSSTLELLYEKKAFSDGKWVLTQATNVTSEALHTITFTRKVDYGTSQGLGVVTGVTLTTQQKWEKANAKPVSQSDEVRFENYKINSGDAFKHFLGDAKSEE